LQLSYFASYSFFLFSSREGAETQRNWGLLLFAAAELSLESSFCSFCLPEAFAALRLCETNSFFPLSSRKDAKPQINCDPLGLPAAGRPQGIEGYRRQGTNNLLINSISLC
jgi:hypothetical protein